MMEPDPNSYYRGEQLVGAESYLRRLPHALVIKERMRFDAVVTAADIITQAYAALRQFAEQAGINPDEFRDGGPTLALSQCWTVVDQLHAIRQLLPAGGKTGPFTQAFRDATESATKLRNSMEHLASQLDNLSKRRGLKPPLFGSLSYFYAPNAEAAAKGGHIVTLMSGALHGADSMPLINPLNHRFMTLPTGLFTLSAFGHELELGSAIGPLRDWIRRVEATIESDLRSKLSETHSADEVEKGMGTFGGGVVMIAKIEFGDEGGIELRPIDP